MRLRTKRLAERMESFQTLSETKEQNGGCGDKSPSRKTILPANVYDETIRQLASECHILFSQYLENRAIASFRALVSV